MVAFGVFPPGNILVSHAKPRSTALYLSLFCFSRFGAVTAAAQPRVSLCQLPNQFQPSQKLSTGQRSSSIILLVVHRANASFVKDLIQYNVLTHLKNIKCVCVCV